jgi:hypothetical protein
MTWNFLFWGVSSCSISSFEKNIKADDAHADLAEPIAVLKIGIIMQRRIR